MKSGAYASRFASTNRKSWRKMVSNLRLATNEAKAKLYYELAEFTGWKFVKSEPCLRLRIDDIILDVIFYSSKYNSLEDVVDVNCEFRIWSKSCDKICNINSKIAYYPIQPDSGYWYDIASVSNLEHTLEDIKNKIEQYVMPVAKAFENGRDVGLSYIGGTKTRDMYHVDSFNAYAKMIKNAGGHRI